MKFHLLYKFYNLFQLRAMTLLSRAKEKNYGRNPVEQCYLDHSCKLSIAGFRVAI